MIKRRVRVTSTGLMVVNMRVAGKMENNTESELILPRVEKPNRENGKMERDFIGYKIPLNEHFYELIIMSEHKLREETNYEYYNLSINKHLTFFTI